MKNASPYIYVANVQESLNYYQEIFGGETKVLNEHAGKVLHAEIYLGSSLIHFSDTYGQAPVSENVNIIIQFDSEEEIRKTYDALLAKGGEIKFELDNTFFGALHGQVTDGLNKINWVMNFFNK